MQLLPYLSSTPACLITAGHHASSKHLYDFPICATGRDTSSKQPSTGSIVYITTSPHRFSNSADLVMDCYDLYDCPESVEEWITSTPFADFFRRYAYISASIGAQLELGFFAIKSWIFFRSASNWVHLWGPPRRIRSTFFKNLFRGAKKIDFFEKFWVTKISHGQKNQKLCSVGCLWCVQIWVRSV